MNRRKTIAEKQKTGSLNMTREKQRKGKVIDLPASNDMMVEYPPAPNDLGEEGKNHWDIVVRELTKIRLITSVDLPILRAMCIEWECYIYHRRQQMDKNIGSYYKIENKNGISYQPHPIHYNGTNHLREYTKLAQEFGLTPASRAAIGITAQDSPKTRASQLLKNAV